MREATTIGILGIAALLITACSHDDGAAEWAERGSELQINACLTRSAALTPDEEVTLAVYQTYGNDLHKGQFIYSPTSGKWRSNIRAAKDEVYQLYGFMPAKNGITSQIDMLDDGYANGAALTINGLNAITDDDVCFIGGVKEGTEVSTSSDITEWNYQFVGQEEEQNFINLLMEHVYANVKMSMLVGSNYATLRTIKLKKILLRPSSTAKTNITISQRNGQRPSFSYEATDEEDVIPYLLENEAGIELSTTQPVIIETNVIPCANHLELVCTYDVYDKDGNPVSKDITTRNDLTGKIDLTPGTRTKLTLTVINSYLYTLSDSDAMNPRIMVE